MTMNCTETCHAADREDQSLSRNISRPIFDGVCLGLEGCGLGLETSGLCLNVSGLGLETTRNAL